MMRSMTRRLRRLLDAMPVKRLQEHGDFLSGFAAADPRHRELVDELARRIGSRALVRLLPTVAPTAVPALPSDLRAASLEALRATLSVAMAGWICDSGAPLPSDAQHSLRFDGPACLVVTECGDLMLCREVVFIEVTSGSATAAIPASEALAGAGDDD